MILFPRIDSLSALKFNYRPSLLQTMHRNCSSALLQNVLQHINRVEFHLFNFTDVLHLKLCYLQSYLRSRELLLKNVKTGKLPNPNMTNLLKYLIIF